MTKNPVLTKVIPGPENGHSIRVLEPGYLPRITFITQRANGPGQYPRVMKVILGWVE